LAEAGDGLLIAAPSDVDLPERGIGIALLQRYLLLPLSVGDAFGLLGLAEEVERLLGVLLGFVKLLALVAPVVGEKDEHACVVRVAREKGLSRIEHLGSILSLLVGEGQSLAGVGGVS